MIYIIVALMPPLYMVSVERDEMLRQYDCSYVPTIII
jgi:hypothetical protein